jgi:hypothetical protein
MREFRTVIFIFISVIFIFGAMGGIINQVDKLLNQGTTVVEGKVISIEKGVFTDCVEISKSTMGESSMVSYCVYYNIELPKLKSNIEITFVKSPFLFKDRIFIKEKKDCK